MSLSIASNVGSLRVQSSLSNTNKALVEVYERLSSGQRINRASDDAAGLAVSETLNANTHIATIAIRNANDGISILSTADSALGAISSILSQLGELATQSASGIYANVQRSALSGEFESLGSEIERIAATTTFNSIKLLSNIQPISLQIGLDGSTTSRLDLYRNSGGSIGTLAALGLGNTSGILLYSLNDISTSTAQSASTLALNAVTSAINTLQSTRGRLGALQSRLSVAIDNLASQKENFSAATSRIRDADVAADAAELVRLQILQQTGAAILGQANQQPARALELLQ